MEDTSTDLPRLSRPIGLARHGHAAVQRRLSTVSGVTHPHRTVVALGLDGPTSRITRARTLPRLAAPPDDADAAGARTGRSAASGPHPRTELADAGRHVDRPPRGKARSLAALSRETPVASRAGDDALGGDAGPATGTEPTTAPEGPVPSSTDARSPSETPVPESPHERPTAVDRASKPVDDESEYAALLSELPTAGTTPGDRSIRQFVERVTAYTDRSSDDPTQSAARPTRPQRAPHASATDAASAASSPMLDRSTQPPRTTSSPERSGTTTETSQPAPSSGRQRPATERRTRGLGHETATPREGIGPAATAAESASAEGAKRTRTQTQTQTQTQAAHTASDVDADIVGSRESTPSASPTPRMRLHRPESGAAATVDASKRPEERRRRSTETGPSGRSGPVAVEPSDETSGGSTPPARGVGERDQNRGVDLGRMVDDVYHALDRRMRIERERRGF